MKNKLITIAGAAILTLALAQTVQATPISGDIGFSGSYTQNGGTAGDLTTATSMTIGTVSISGTVDGSFVGATSPAFASPISVNGHLPSLVGNVLWTVDVGANMFTFTVNSEAQYITLANSIGLEGSGTITDSAADPSVGGAYQLVFGNTGTSFTFQATDTTFVPDGASTLTLLGIALSGMALLKKKLIA